MRRTALFLCVVWLALPREAEAKWGDFSLRLSQAAGGELQPEKNTSMAIAFLSTELTLAMEVCFGYIDLGVVWARLLRDAEPTPGTAPHRASFRPGIRVVVAGRLRSDEGVAGYLRFALPVQYNADEKRARFGFLTGIGIEARVSRRWSTFLEATVAPFISSETAIPFEARIGIALGF